ncbi:hypothetical protein SAMN04515671_2775 [Nakamurella panacisegetis]|uniref:Uncharacterized protein n=1 Tax=Nakamurella panacisegetis TaxID=1090615 RepID=A0A1H0PI81_9ACTN|nr:hypothetical protein SAMN04515671_2775 [Nakamurella panacisegetis]
MPGESGRIPTAGIGGKWPAGRRVEHALIDNRFALRPLRSGVDLVQALGDHLRRDLDRRIAVHWGDGSLG